MKQLWMAIPLLVLAGCSIGIKDDGANAIRTNFKVDATYQETFRRADAFAHRCHTSTNPLLASFNVAGNLYADNKSGVVRINLPTSGKDLERIELAESKNGGTDVSLTAWGVGMWDQRELAAARQSIESGTPSCR